MPTLGDLPGEPRAERPEPDDDDIQQRSRSPRVKLLATIVIVALAAPALVGLLNLLGG
ncbi:hypothetical protein GCM10011490_09060 [Pseudoclavibacter endophyticus]|uniref:hypothetical protein n=1 Tax=Pseudoclavibacter endophyticus TaxID=1778590 RepID=UPI0016637549|nr:hypothetical protein [Pseudoclavibacter endophyticus]GGA61062.1 hypothetical protein GCM10011490_09060 [Pseudoclavibacter endophyticus]